MIKLDKLYVFNILISSYTYFRITYGFKILITKSNYEICEYRVVLFGETRKLNYKVFLFKILIVLSCVSHMICLLILSCSCLKFRDTF